MSWYSVHVSVAARRTRMTRRSFVCTLFAACALSGCSGSTPAPTLPASNPFFPSTASAPPPTTPAPGSGINGQYRGELTFTYEDLSYGWPQRLTVLANLQQTGADVTGDFDLVEAIDSGGYVKGTVDTANGDIPAGTFSARFLPDDLGDPFSIDTKITSPDGGRFEGTFIFADDVVGHGTATFIRVK